MKSKSDIISPDDKYLLPGPDQVCFAAAGQTLSLVMGSCISTVFVGRNGGYIISANHIMIARERSSGIIAKRSARQQIDEILRTYNDVFNIPDRDLRCLHLVGAGTKVSDTSFRVHDDNIRETGAALSEKSFVPLFDDTRSFYFATYSLSGSDMSVFIEDKLNRSHLSYIIDLDKLYFLDPRQLSNLPASALKPNNRGFEDFVKMGIIVFITGEKNRPDV